MYLQTKLSFIPRIYSYVVTWPQRSLNATLLEIREITYRNLEYLV